MKKLIALATVAAGLSFPVVSAHAFGLGTTGNGTMSSGGLINVSPSVQTGSLNVLSGTGNGILNGSSILSGSPILSGNNTGVGVLGTGTGLLNNVIGNVTGGLKKR